MKAKEIVFGLLLTIAAISLIWYSCEYIRSNYDANNWIIVAAYAALLLIIFRLYKLVLKYFVP